MAGEIIYFQTISVSFLSRTKTKRRGNTSLCRNPIYVCMFIPFRGFWEKSPETGLSASPRTLSARSTNVSRGLGGNDDLTKG